MKFEYEFFMLPVAPYLAEPRRVAVKEWLNSLGADGWEVFAIAPLRDNEAGLGVYAKRPIPEAPLKLVCAICGKCPAHCDCPTPVRAACFGICMECR